MTKFYLHIILSIVCLSNFVLAQNIEETNYYYYKSNPNELFPIDTGLNNVEDYNLMSTDDFDYVNLGNTGQAHYALKFNWNDKIGFKDGMNHFNRYKYSIDKIKYYKVNKPLSQIHYFMGSKREGIFGATLATNIKNQLELGVEFHRIASTGVYRNMRTRNGDFSLYSLFTSKNSKYNLNLEITFSKIKTEENGGLVEDFINIDSLAEINKEFYTPNISDGLTQHKNFDVLLTNTYHIGKTKIDSINDSTKVEKFNAAFSLNHTFGYSRNRYDYTGNLADSSYYDDFYQGNDSIYYNLNYFKIPNRFALSYSGLNILKDSLQYLNLEGEFGVQHDYIKLFEPTNTFNTNNVHVFGKIQSNPKSKEKWNYLAETYYFISGYNKNDWKFKGVFAYNFGKIGLVELEGSIEQQEATWIENSYNSNTITWNNNFNKKSRTRFSINYHLPKYKLKLHAEYNAIGKLIYFDENALAQQLNNTTQYWQAYINKDFNYKILHFDNFIGIQGNSNTDYLRLPKVFFKSSLYVEGHLFKGLMKARFGADLKYNSNFMANAWQPLTGQFYLQNTQNMKYTPVLDIFLSFKVKTLRVFAKANYINEGLIRRNYYTALGYPDRGRTFAGGLIWRFFE